MRGQYPATWLPAALTLLACIVTVFAADRPARVITPQGSPIWLDPLETLVFDTPLLAGARVEHLADHGQQAPPLGPPLGVAGLARPEGFEVGETLFVHRHTLVLTRSPGSGR